MRDVAPEDHALRVVAEEQVTLLFTHVPDDGGVLAEFIGGVQEVGVPGHRVLATAVTLLGVAILASHDGLTFLD